MIAIIPARGGSKRLPRKNIKLLDGKPLIAYTIEAALKCKSIDKVIVTTDDEEISQIAVTYGAIVQGLRPIELSNDTASSNDVVKYELAKLEKVNHCKVEACILLQPTSPLRTTTHIEEALALFEEKKADAVIAFTKEHHPLYWNKFLSLEGKLEEIRGLENRESYYPNGSIYVLSAKVIESGIYYTDNTYAYIMERTFSLDIDTPDDWDLVEFFIKKENGTQKEDK